MTHEIYVGLGFGDEGKGASVDRACSSASGLVTVVRYNGGCQAAHNVVRDNGDHHTFAQFGSGTLAGARTFLSRFMMVEPLALQLEAEHLRTLGIADPFERLYVDENCLLTTPYHWIANREAERRRGVDRHGSCGRGIGETASYALDVPAAPRVGDFRYWGQLKVKLTLLRRYVVDRYPYVDVPMVDDVVDRYRHIPLQTVKSDYLEGLSDNGKLVFEGAQGILLDEWFGFHPYTTWSTTTAENALTLLDELGEDNYKVIGVLRSYGTRHGPGPFPTEDLTLELPDTHNSHGEHQGGWRVGHFDAVLLKYALKVNGGVDEIALTHMDRAGAVKQCVEYEVGGLSVRDIPVGTKGRLSHQDFLTMRLSEANPVYLDEPVDMVGLVEEIAEAPVTTKGYGPTTSAVVQLAQVK